MKIYEKRVRLIDDAIIDKGGKWNSPYNHLLISTVYNDVRGEGCWSEVSTLEQVECAKPYWEYVCSKEEFMQRKQELQDKPSWDNAPEWAEWLAQDRSGEWYWYEDEPTVDSDYNWWDNIQKTSCASWEGDVVGDWKDTLEQRPYTLGGVEVVNSSKSRSWDDLFIHIDTRRTINAEHTDIIMPDGSKIKLLDLLLDSKAIKQYALEQKVAQVLEENAGLDAASVAKMVLKTLEEKDDER